MNHGGSIVGDEPAVNNLEPDFVYVCQTFFQEGESTSTQCDDLEVLKTKGCPPDEIENPRGSQAMPKNKEVTNRVKGAAENLKPEDITQIQPQQVQLKLRIGKDVRLTEMSYSLCSHHYSRN